MKYSNDYRHLILWETSFLLGVKGLTAGYTIRNTNTEDAIKHTSLTHLAAKLNGLI